MTLHPRADLLEGLNDPKRLAYEQTPRTQADRLLSIRFWIKTEYPRVERDAIE